MFSVVVRCLLLGHAIASPSEMVNSTKGSQQIAGQPAGSPLIDVSSSLRVLVVDDHEEVLELVGRALEKDGHEVRAVATDRAAREQLSSGWAQVVVLDLGLPDGGGEELCAWLQGIARPAILVLTARSAVKSRVRCLDLGADDYLTKPFAVAELRARVRALGRRPGLGVGAPLRMGPAVLDFARREARVSGREVPITAREWAILKALTEARGAVVDRATLLERIWGGIDKGNEASLEVLIGRIRRKLGTEVVRTVRGRGYAIHHG